MTAIDFQTGFSSLSKAPGTIATQEAVDQTNYSNSEKNLRLHIRLH